jgi:hypothetical protein
MVDSRSALVALQAHQAAPIALVGPSLGARSREPCQALLLAQSRAAFCTRRGLEKVRLRFGGRSPMRTRCPGLMRSAFKRTFPPLMAAVARLLVL